MNTWASHHLDGPRQRRASRFGRSGLRWLVVALAFLVPMIVTVELKHSGERAAERDRDLESVIAELQTQDGLGWRAISNRFQPGDVAPQLAESREQVRVLLDRSTDGRTATRLRQLHDGYATAVDEMLALLAAGDRDEAAEFDEAEVGPALEEVLDALQEQSASEYAAASRARSLSDRGRVLTVLLALGVTTIVQSRRKRDQIREQAERRSEARYRALIERSTDLVMVTDPAGVVGFCSPSAERLLSPDVGSDGGDARAASKDLAHIDLLGSVTAADRGRLAEALHQRGADGGGTTVEVELDTRAGMRTFNFSVQDLTNNPTVGGMLLTGRDVTDQRALQAEMEHRALHDALTGLPNRSLLGDRFDQALAGARRSGTAVGLLLIDLDRFKEINDTFGHHYGDALLTQVGPRLNGVLRDVDTLARLGGDEFAVLLPGVLDAVGVGTVARKLQAALQAPFRVDGVDLYVEASIGAVISGEHGTDATTLMQRADIAMYAAKTQNLGVFTYDPAVDGHSPDKLALLGELRQALARDELVLHYQPKVSITTGDIVGAEALVRWEHPERGLVFPDAFIGLAEHSGLIGPLTHHVLSTALAQARTWLDAGQQLPVSVNLSARNLLDDGLPDQVAKLLAKHGVPARLLELEVTESAIMTEPVRARRLLDALAALGVRLSIDDFGAGYTSLAQLKNLAITELKIDKSFVMAMTSQRSDALIVHSVVELGHNLGLTLVAEGVEDCDALTLLGAYGCDVAQGYHLSRPVPPVAFDRWRADRPDLVPITVAASSGGEAAAVV